MNTKKKKTAGLFALALMVGISFVGASSYASAHGGNVSPNSEQNMNFQNRGNISGFQDEMWESMDEYGMGPGMMMNGRATGSNGMNFGNMGGNGGNGFGGFMR